jgi:hypothetical protein
MGMPVRPVVHLVVMCRHPDYPDDDVNAYCGGLILLGPEALDVHIG